MSVKYLSGLIPLLLLCGSLWWLPWQDRKGSPDKETPSSAPPAPAPAAALTEAVAAPYQPISFGEIFVTPAGPEGLEYTAKARRLAGQKVRLQGYMVRHAHEDAAVFLFSAEPKTLIMEEFGLADDLPPYAAHVILPLQQGMAPDWVRGALEVFGTLEIGPRAELDSRISYVRIQADHLTPAGRLDLIEPRRSIMLQPARLKSGKVSPGSLSNPLPR